MERRLISLADVSIPEIFRPLLSGCPIYDSSCSPAARVYYIEKDGGYYLKTAPQGTLEREASLTRFFHSRQLSSEVLAYESLDADWLLTARIPGEDCLSRQYLDDPVRLCDTLASLLRQLHEQNIVDCLLPNHTEDYLATACANHAAGKYDTGLFPDNWGFSSAAEAWQVVETYSPCLKADTLLHGDCCLPNILLKDWNFSGFIDLGGAGAGDRHVDLFWAIWSLQFNLKTNRYRDRFLDSYGRDLIDEDMLRLIGAIEVFL